MAEEIKNVNAKIDEAEAAVKNMQVKIQLLVLAAMNSHQQN